MDSGKTRVIRGTAVIRPSTKTRLSLHLRSTPTRGSPRHASLFHTAAAVLPVNPQIFRLFPLSLRGYCFSSYTSALTLPLHQCSAVTGPLTYTNTLTPSSRACRIAHCMRPSVSPRSITGSRKMFKSRVLATFSCKIYPPTFISA